MKKRAPRTDSAILMDEIAKLQKAVEALRAELAALAKQAVCQPPQPPWPPATQTPWFTRPDTTSDPSRHTVWW